MPEGYGLSSVTPLARRLYRPQRARPSVFQLVVLPYLASRSLPPQPVCVFSTSTSSSRSSADASASPVESWSASWPYTAPPPHLPLRSSQSKAREYLDLRSTPPAAPETVPKAGVPCHIKTAEMALQRLVEAHRRPPDGAESNSKAASSSRSTSRGLMHAESLPQDPTLAPIHPIPPTIHRLLAARLYRLAVFRLLSTPEYASDRRLIQRVVDRLEREGAGKVARRLALGCELNRENGPIKTDASEASPRPRLWSEPEPQDRPRRPPDHWRPLTTVSITPDYQSFPTRQAALTKHFNAQLSSLFAPSASLPSHIHRPSPSLRQLRQLLHRIDHLQKHRGFQPDRVTANIIVRCWLRCGAGHGHSADSTRCRVVTTRNGETKLAWKKRSEAEFGPKELLKLFDAVSGLMSAPAPPASEGSKRVGEDGGNDLNYHRHVKPFVKMMVRSLHDFGDHAGVKKVLTWQAEQRGAFAAIGRTEAARRHETREGE